jgi:NAD(P)-dependent dehydrogenase (short-subunit alcohol dehydrogenase family)
MKWAMKNVLANALPPGVADTPQHANNPKDFLRTLPPIGAITTVQELVDEIVHLMGAATITGEVLHVDYGARFGAW